MENQRLKRLRSLILGAAVIGLGCTDSPIAPRAADAPLPNTSILAAATATTIVVTPSTPVGALFVSGVAGDYVPGYESGSIAQNGGATKTDMYFPPAVLFGRDVTLGEIARMSYWTKTGATHTADPRDWFLAIYTKPFTGDYGTWYGTRIGSEPYFSANLSDPANTWNNWTTDGADNQLRFFESTQGAPGANFGSYADPHWNTFVAGNSLGTSVPYAGQEVLFFSLQTGSAWTNGFTGKLDGLVIELTDGSTATVNFEPASTSWGACLWSVSGTTQTLLADCVTSQTLQVPDGFTLDGSGFTITAVDPPGGHFLGAVVKNGGATAHVTNVAITTSGLANVCDGGDARLRGILFANASGSITNSTVSGVRQGLSGCQEGNAIEARNFDLSGNPAATQVEVAITGNLVSNYQKNGITTNGSVAATIDDNVVTGDGPAPYIAQNGIQVGFGATALVQGNTITGNFYSGSYWISCGLLTYDANGVKQKRNAITDNQKDLCNFGGRGGGKFNLDQP